MLRTTNVAIEDITRKLATLKIARERTQQNALGSLRMTTIT